MPTIVLQVLVEYTSGAMPDPETVQAEVNTLLEPLLSSDGMDADSYNVVFEDVI